MKSLLNKSQSVVWGMLALLAAFAIAQRVVTPSPAASDSASPIVRTRPRAPWLGPGETGEAAIQFCQCLVPHKNQCPQTFECPTCLSNNGLPYIPDNFSSYGPGEYVGRARLQHVPQYRLRVDDELELV